MSLKAYEDACMRAELFGDVKPDKDEFLEQNKHLDNLDVNIDEDIIIAENTAMLNERLTNATSGLDELNSILRTTQSKLSRFKGVCGNITNIFRIKFGGSKDNIATSTCDDNGYVDISLSPTNSVGPTHSDDVNTAIDDLKVLQGQQDKPIIKDVTSQVNSQIDKLDRLISNAEHAQTTMQHQNAQMRSFLK